MNEHETEVKFLVHDLTKIEMRLLELKAHLIQARIHEVNLRFDTLMGDLRHNFEVLRLRKDTEARLTFKGPGEARAGGVLSRREIEFTVGDFGSAQQFLEALGFTPVVFYEKFRTTYEINDVHVMLDELPYGRFVEIEGHDIDALQQTAKQLGLRWSAMVRAGYHALFERIADRHKLDPTELSFNALDGLRITPDELGATPADKE